MRDDDDDDGDGDDADNHYYDYSGLGMRGAPTEEGEEDYLVNNSGKADV